jgi:ribosomal protein S18 acetylase RimI-like enzyme
MESPPMNRHAPGPRSGGPGPVSLRPEHPDDEAFLFAVYASTREEELAITGWDEATRTAFLNMQFRAMRVGYRSSFPQAQFSIVLCDGCPVGRLVVDRTNDEIHVVDVALLPACRSRGIGTVLMRDLCVEAERRGRPIRLRVLKNSPALRFYQRLGFKPIAELDFDVQMEWRSGNRGPGSGAQAQKP